MFDSILQAIGHTPLVKLRRLSEGLAPTIVAKIEAQNPGGSTKDRVAVAMIAEAEKSGLLKPGGTIIEATAGNTGVGLAMVAAVKGYRCIFVLPDKMSSEKVALLKAYGAEVVITPTAVAPDAPESYSGVADRLSREIPGAWRPNQFTNLSNPEIHYRTTGPEIWDGTHGTVTHCVGGIGTGGTVSGVGRYLKERNPDIKMIGADPEGSILSGGAPASWKVEGIGEDFVPKTFNAHIIDDWVRVSDAESFHTAREMAKKEGILVGGSCGTALAAGLKYARRLTATDVMVIICPDTGRNYMSKMYDDAWLALHKLTWIPADAVRTVQDLLTSKGEKPLLSVSLSDTAARAIQTLREAGISQVPVIENGQPVGSVQEITLARILHDQRDPAMVSVGEIMAKPLPALDVGTHLDEAYRLLMAGNTGVLATQGGHVVGIVTRIDLIDYWSRK